jgi:xanthine/CO dehydrogenase XdhC/CoxF family maturation factor
MIIGSQQFIDSKDILNWLEEANAKEERIERERPPIGYWIVRID